MFYIAQDNKLLNYADRKYNEECAYTDIITQAELDKYPNKIILEDNVIKLNPDFEIEELQKAKKAKYAEANYKANEYLQSGEALFEFEEGKHIEATDGNIAKMTAYALAYVTGQLSPEDTVAWNTKEDETVELTQQQIVMILQGLGQEQGIVWTAKFPVYVAQIENAETIEAVNEIVIDYSLDINIEE